MIEIDKINGCFWSKVDGLIVVIPIRSITAIIYKRTFSKIYVKSATTAIYESTSLDFKDVESRINELVTAMAEYNRGD